MYTERLELTSGSMHARFDFTDGHTGILCNPNEMVVSCRYPDMRPFGPAVRPNNNALDIRLRLRRGPTRIEQMIMADPPLADANAFRHAYHIGPLGRYEIYHQERVDSGLLHHSAIYVFRADDGAVVGIEEEGDSVPNFYGCRRIGHILHLDYIFPRQLGKDFFAIDGAVNAFIQSSLDMVWDEERLLNDPLESST